MNKRTFMFRVCFVLVITLSLCLCFSPKPIQATSLSQTQTAPPDNETCLSCHDQPDWEWKLANGDILNLSIHDQVFNQSVHKNMACVDCHIGYEQFPNPHNQITATNKREYMISYHDTCQKCHQEQFELVSDSVHDALFLSGEIDTPLCADCHQPHNQTHIDDLDIPQEAGKISWQAQICADCHQTEFETYQESAHGQGLLIDENGDMPDCVDCHDVHSICDPQKSFFRQSSVDTCAKCHTNASIMEKYGLETNVLDTYLVFHDTTVTLLEEYNPDSLTNKPTCYDCHGIHEVGSITPPAIEADISAMTLYPEVEIKQAGPPLEDVGITGLIIGILIGSVGTLTISGILKEKKQIQIDEVE